MISNKSFMPNVLLLSWKLLKSPNCYCLQTHLHLQDDRKQKPLTPKFLWVLILSHTVMEIQHAYWWCKYNKFYRTSVTLENISIQMILIVILTMPTIKKNEQKRNKHITIMCMTQIKPEIFKWMAISLMPF